MSARGVISARAAGDGVGGQNSRVFLPSLFLLALGAPVFAQTETYKQLIDHGIDIIRQTPAEARKDFHRAWGISQNADQNADATYWIALTYAAEQDAPSAIDWLKTSLAYKKDERSENALKKIQLSQWEKPQTADQIKSALLRSPDGKSPSVELISIDLEILFETDEATLKDDGVAQIRELGTALKDPSFEGKRFRITGHADITGSHPHNMELSVRRANAVSRELQARYGIGRDRMEVVGKGDTEPKLPGNDPEVNRLNRRVQVSLLP